MTTMQLETKLLHISLIPSLQTVSNQKLGLGTTPAISQMQGIIVHFCPAPTLLAIFSNKSSLLSPPMVADRYLAQESGGGRGGGGGRRGVELNRQRVKCHAA